MVHIIQGSCVRAIAPNAFWFSSWCHALALTIATGNIYRLFLAIIFCDVIDIGVLYRMFTD